MNSTNFEQIVHTIRNMKQLTKDQKNSISSLTDEEKNQIIYLYDEMMSYSLDIINQIYLKEENYHK
jgi:hypothetical protein